MSTVQIIAAAFGFTIIGVTAWKIVRNGIAKSNGRIPESDGNWWGN